MEVAFNCRGSARDHLAFFMVATTPAGVAYELLDQGRRVLRHHWDSLWLPGLDGYEYGQMRLSKGPECSDHPSSPISLNSRERHATMRPGLPRRHMVHLLS